MRLNKNDLQILEFSVRVHLLKDMDIAAEYGLRFDLTFNEYLKLIMSRCYFCHARGTTPITTRHKRSQLDRRDRLQHFTVDNSIACCRLCFKARRVVNPKMIFRVVQVNRKLGLIDGKNKATTANQKPKP